MTPAWLRIADELRAVADDRTLAASHEPDIVEAGLLRREAALLARAAMLAGSGLAPTSLAAAADGGWMHDGDSRPVLWGVTGDGEAALRRLARDPAVDVQQVDPAVVLAAVLGVPSGGSPA